MKKIIILLFIIFFYVFLKSNTIEQKHWREENNGAEYLRTSYKLNWDNFTDYLQELYQKSRAKILKSR
ncbi:MAG: hypothetical protein Q8N14_07135 [Candidatus Omnitrophota bacterium]|nr:hypothetical protein [Candidatus Omnitrophota bacterium]